MTDEELREQAALLLPGWTRKALEVRQPPQETAEPFIWISPTGVSCVLGPELNGNTAMALLEVVADTDGATVVVGCINGHSRVSMVDLDGVVTTREPATAKHISEICVLALVRAGAGRQG